MNWQPDLLSPVSLSAVFVLVGVLALALLVARFMVGRPAEIARRWGLIAIRGLVVLLLLLLLTNPVRVSESPGAIEQADVFYMIDASESMQMQSGDGRRWDEAIEIIRKAKSTTGDEVAADIKLFRFGNRLTSIEERTMLVGTMSNPATLSNVARQLEDERGLQIEPTDTDTRLQMALRQITSRFGRSPPASLVLFSDGRARDAQGVQAMARHFAELDVPIHVVPVGGAAQGGDVAIVAAVVPQSVRRHSRVEVQVFLRSYGFDGRRAEVYLSALNDDGTPGRSLTAPQPITLHSGFQSHSLSFRADKDTRRLLIHIPPQEDEISNGNNAIESEIYIDHTKIRVLYVEGTRQLPRPIRQGDSFVMRGPYTELEQALTADDDIECVVVSGAFGDLRRLDSDGNLDERRGFPQTKAELSAFDALVLSNVSRESFTDEQIDWIEYWIRERGAGLCMVGGPFSFASGGWGDGSLAKILPVVISEGESDWDPGAVVNGSVDISSTLHPIWHIVSDAKHNRSIVEQFPVFDGANRGLRVKQSLATALVTAPLGSSSAATSLGSPDDSRVSSAAAPSDNASGDQLPVIAVGRYGKGRSMSLATAISEPWARAFLNDWGEGDNRYYAKFWRNVIYWLTEDSTIGRRRLIASHDKRYYKPGDTIALRAIAYDEGANLTQDYRIETIVDPSSLDTETLISPIRWPNGVPRDSGEEGPFVYWGETFELPKLTAETAGPLGGGEEGYGIELKIADVLASGAANTGVRLELTALEGQTQVDSTSLEIHILHDPFEQQNPFPDHELLEKVANISGGRVLGSSDDLAQVLTAVEVKRGPPVVRKSPLWSNWWVWSAIVGLLAVDWFWRRSIGLA